MNLDEHINGVVKRSRNFYIKKDNGHILLNVRVPYGNISTPPLYYFDLESQLDEYLEYQLNVSREKWNAKEGLEDDYIPAICPRFGVAEHSAWLGAEVLLQEDTCLPVPFIENIADIDRLLLNKESSWFQLMKRGYEFLRSKKDGSFVLSVRGTMAPMDIANAIRGDSMFTDFLLNPEFAHKLMQKLVEAIQWYYNHILSWADKVHDGHVYYMMDNWMGPDSLGHLSNDAAMLCSAAVYEEFGYPYEVELVKNWKNIFYHVHNEKVHYFPKLVELPGLALLEVSQDPKTVPPIEDLENIFNVTDSVNLMLHATSQQVRDQIEMLKKRNVYLDVTCADKKDAQDIIQFVRKHSKPLD